MPRTAGPLPHWGPASCFFFVAEGVPCDRHGRFWSWASGPAAASLCHARVPRCPVVGLHGRKPLAAIAPSTHWALVGCGLMMSACLYPPPRSCACGRPFCRGPLIFRPSPPHSHAQCNSFLVLASTDNKTGGEAGTAARAGLPCAYPSGAVGGILLSIDNFLLPPAAGATNKKKSKAPSSTHDFAWNCLRFSAKLRAKPYKVSHCV